MQGGIILLSTYPDEKTALRAARKIVKSRLAACVSITRTRSLYWWEDKVQDANEYMAIFKSTKNRTKKLKEAIAKSHPYKVPEIVELRMNDVARSYMKWMMESVTA